MNETWLPVVGYEGRYEVSDLGRVRGVDRIAPDGKRIRGKLMKPFASHNGYLYVDIRRDNETHRVPIAFAVLTAFRGPAPDGHECAHLDGTRFYNALANLAWKTHAENCADKLAHGTDLRGEKSGTAKLTATMVESIRVQCAAGNSQGKVGLAFGVSQTQVSRIITRQRWAHL